MKIFIGAENIISPLGNTAQQNFSQLQENHSGVQLFKNAGFNKEGMCLSKIIGTQKDLFDDYLVKCVAGAIAEIDKDLIISSRTIVIISTTKGDIKNSLEGTLSASSGKLQQKFSLQHFPLLISNGCASGVIAIAAGADLIRAGIYDHAIIVGGDVISDFVLFGFQSLFAISSERCRPFDKNRNGITLGDGFGAVVLSNDKATFNDATIEYLDGSSSNDANHISGPSRTGEGLFHSVKKTMELAKVKTTEIDFISAHGTGTIYNDDMESIAFNRLEMNEVPVNSLKAYFGHTLGAAGIIETAICLQSMRKNMLIKSLGFEEPGTTQPLNVITKNYSHPLTTILKTVSGFGGCNASLILRKS